MWLRIFALVVFHRWATRRATSRRHVFGVDIPRLCLSLEIEELLNLHLLGLLIVNESVDIVTQRLQLLGDL